MKIKLNKGYRYSIEILTPSQKKKKKLNIITC